MHQHNPFRDFDSLPSQPKRLGLAKSLIGALILAAAALAAGIAGYGFGRGAWTPPQSVSGGIPAPLGASQTAELKGYALALADTQAKQGEAVLSVRLLHGPSGRPVPDAVIFAHRLDMAPEGMPTMTAQLEPQPSPEPGLYRFKTDLTMEGGWRLSLAAKVQGEAGTVRNTLTLRAVP